MQICYDLRFPVWSRNRGDYDVALYVASCQFLVLKFGKLYFGLVQ